ncbi:MAG: hypothetical protein PHU23_11895 [Dehalococcoidales bacterium]|nr:hypothetical protein [Dehalococcoidales bacterium]
MKRSALLVLVWCFTALATPLLAAGLTANFGEVLIEDLKIGYPFSTREKANLPYIITNVGYKTIDVKVEIVIPSAQELKKGYEPIPNTAWIKLERNFFSLKPNEQGSTDLVFNIPNDEKLLGKKFDAIVYPYTFEGILKIGVNSHVLFTIDKEKGPYPIYLDAKPFKDKVAFEVSPLEMSVKNVPIGKKVDLKRHSKTILKITNTTDQECRFYLNSIKVKESSVNLKEGYQDTPDANILSFDEKMIRIKPKETKEVKLYLTFPAGKEFAGKDYMFILPIVTGEQDAPLIRYAYLYVTTKK